MKRSSSTLNNANAQGAGRFDSLKTALSNPTTMQASAMNYATLTMSASVLSEEDFDHVAKFCARLYDGVPSPHVIIQLENVSLIDRRLPPLLSVLHKRANLAELDLSHNLIEDAGFSELVKACCNASSGLQLLSLQWNRIGPEGSRLAGVQLSTSPFCSLRNLSLWGNLIKDPGIVALAHALTDKPHQIESLNLEGCGGTPESAESLKGLLGARHTKLKKLLLGDNSYTDESALLLADTLQKNTMLVMLTLDGNELLTERGSERLFEAQEARRSLDSRCQLSLDLCRTGPQRLKHKWWREPQLTIEIKECRKLTSPPPRWANGGYEEVRCWVEDLRLSGEVPLNHVKMVLLGNGRAGKTRFCLEVVKNLSPLDCTELKQFSPSESKLWLLNLGVSQSALSQLERQGIRLNGQDLVSLFDTQPSTNTSGDRPHSTSASAKQRPSSAAEQFMDESQLPRAVRDEIVKKWKELKEERASRLKAMHSLNLQRQGEAKDGQVMQDVMEEEHKGRPVLSASSSHYPSTVAVNELSAVFPRESQHPNGDQLKLTIFDCPGQAENTLQQQVFLGKDPSQTIFVLVVAAAQLVTDWDTRQSHWEVNPDCLAELRYWLSFLNSSFTPPPTAAASTANCAGKEAEAKPEQSVPSIALLVIVSHVDVFPKDDPSLAALCSEMREEIDSRVAWKLSLLGDKVHQLDYRKPEHKLALSDIIKDECRRSLANETIPRLYQLAEELVDTWRREMEQNMNPPIITRSQLLEALQQQQQLSDSATSSSPSSTATDQQAGVSLTMLAHLQRLGLIFTHNPSPSSSAKSGCDVILVYPMRWFSQFMTSLLRSEEVTRGRQGVINVEAACRYLRFGDREKAAQLFVLLQALGVCIPVPVLDPVLEPEWALLADTGNRAAQSTSAGSPSALPMEYLFPLLLGPAPEELRAKMSGWCGRQEDYVPSDSKYTLAPTAFASLQLAVIQKVQSREGTMLHHAMGEDGYLAAPLTVRIYQELVDITARSTHTGAASGSGNRAELRIVIEWRPANNTVRVYTARPANAVVQLDGIVEDVVEQLQAAQLKWKGPMMVAYQPPARHKRQAAAEQAQGGSKRQAIGHEAQLQCDVQVVSEDTRRFRDGELWQRACEVFDSAFRSSYLDQGLPLPSDLDQLLSSTIKQATACFTAYMTIGGKVGQGDASHRRLVGLVMCEDRPDDVDNRNMTDSAAERLPVVYVSQLAVHPSYQERGVGTALMRRVWQYSEQLGRRRTVLQVRAKNKTAVRFYQNTLGGRLCQFSHPDHPSTEYAAFDWLAEHRAANMLYDLAQTARNGSSNSSR